MEFIPLPIVTHEYNAVRLDLPISDNAISSTQDWLDSCSDVATVTVDGVATIGGTATVGVGTETAAVDTTSSPTLHTTGI